jgi:hypothetical protein
MPLSSFGRVARVVSGSLATLLLGALVAAAQNPPLAEVARKEEERRKTAKPATKVLTNKDLPKVSSPAPDATGQAPVTPPETPKLGGDAGKADVDKAEKDQAEKPKREADQAEKTKREADQAEKTKDEAWWRARINEPREQLRRDEVLLDALQMRINGLTTDFIGRDDPYQRARIGEDRQKAIAELERVRTEIVDLKKKIEDIEEEARRASVPPGWLR